MLALARRRAWQRAAAFVSPPAPGRNVGRAFSPAVLRLAAPQGLRDDASIVPCGGGAMSCRILQDISAASRQCPPPSAPYGASTSPCRGGFANGFHPKGSPARGAVGVRRLRGAAPCLANILPSCLKPPRPCGAALTQNHSVTPPQAALQYNVHGQWSRERQPAPLRKHTARPCQALQDISAASRQCTPPSAPYGASTSPCRGGFANGFHPKGSPARGAVGVRRLRGAAPCLANTLPGCLKPPRPCGAALTQNHSITPPQTSLAGVFARRLGPSAAAKFRDDASIVPCGSIQQAPRPLYPLPRKM